LTESRFGTSIISTILAPTSDKPATASLPNQPTKTDNKRQTKITPERKLEKTASAMASVVTAKNISTPATKTKQTIEKPQNELHSTESASTKATNTITPAPTLSFASQQAHQRNYLLGEVQNRLSKYLIYPQRARRRGWQGQVTIAIHITHQGRLNNVRLAKSSGYALLDDSALMAITKLGQISLPESLGPLQAMDLLLPVSYQLRES
jgi:protein TonB